MTTTEITAFSVEGARTERVAASQLAHGDRVYTRASRVLAGPTMLTYAMPVRRISFIGEPHADRTLVLGFSDGACATTRLTEPWLRLPPGQPAIVDTDDDGRGELIYQ